MLEELWGGGMALEDTLLSHLGNHRLPYPWRPSPAPPFSKRDDWSAKPRYGAPRTLGEKWPPRSPEMTSLGRPRLSRTAAGGIAPG